MGDDDFNDRRTTNGPGRRAEDYLYESLVDRLRRLEDRLEAVIVKFERAVEKLTDRQNDSEERTRQRVDDLEDFHIQDQAVTKNRVVERTKSLEVWQKWAVGLTAVSALSAIVALIVSLTS